MDLLKAIRDLYAEKQRIDRAIAHLQELAGGATPPDAMVRKPGRRGRKSMTPEERAEVSARMKEHWARRRKALNTPPPPVGMAE